MLKKRIMVVTVSILVLLTGCVSFVSREDLYELIWKELNTPINQIPVNTLLSEWVPDSSSDYRENMMAVNDRLLNQLVRFTSDEEEGGVFYYRFTTSKKPLYFSFLNSSRTLYHFLMMRFQKEGIVPVWGTTISPAIIPNDGNPYSDDVWDQRLIVLDMKGSHMYMYVRETLSEYILYFSTQIIVEDPNMSAVDHIRAYNQIENYEILRKQYIDEVLKPAKDMRAGEYKKFRETVAAQKEQTKPSTTKTNWGAVFGAMSQAAADYYEGKASSSHIASSSTPSGSWKDDSRGAYGNTGSYDSMDSPGQQTSKNSEKRYIEYHGNLGYGFYMKQEYYLGDDFFNKERAWELIESSYSHWMLTTYGRAIDFNPDHTAYIIESFGGHEEGVVQGN